LTGDRGQTRDTEIYFVFSNVQLILPRYLFI